jgi:hypothetical protein
MQTFVVIDVKWDPFTGLVVVEVELLTRIPEVLRSNLIILLSPFTVRVFFNSNSGKVESNWVHSALRLPIGLFYLP